MILIHYYVTQPLMKLIINFSVSSFSSFPCPFFTFDISHHIDTQFCICFNYTWHFRKFVIGVIYIFYIFSLNNQPSTFRLPWLRFSVIFLSHKANARVYDTKSGHGLHSPHPQARRLHLSACKMSFLRPSQSGLRTQTANQAKFIPTKISVVPPRR